MVWSDEQQAVYQAYGRLGKAVLEAVVNARMRTREKDIEVVFHPGDRAPWVAGCGLLGYVADRIEGRKITYSAVAQPGQPVAYLPRLGRYLRAGEDPATVWYPRPR
ncbi:hypothetical protein ACFC1T_09720 [Kitasatospora sp. NPDC056076]|uniref:hypothetical protein n=1 Tax=Kitasatospora sp. NPDC056076 TaxID=3345703 RepID=UPI0035E34796